MTHAFTRDAIQSAARARGFAIMDEAAEASAATLEGFVGAWQQAMPAPLARLPGSDPCHGAVWTLDVPATGKGALKGMRLTVKDNIAVGGVPMALGTGVSGFVPAEDARSVAAARRAGARIVSIAQCEAFLAGTNSFTSRPYPVRNPHDPARSAGGSSSGCAALLAQGLADIALGTDSGGSARIPAAFCGVTGMKPSRGKVALTGAASFDPWLETLSPMARDMSRLSALFGAIEGRDGRDPRQTGLSRKTRPPVRRLGSARLAYSPAALAMCEPGVASVLATALESVEAAGARLTPLDWAGLEEANLLHLALYVCGLGKGVERRGSQAGALTDPEGFAAWQAGLEPGAIAFPVQLALSASDALNLADPGLHGRAVARARVMAAELDEALSRYDGFLLPVTPSLAPLIPQTPDLAAIFGDSRFTAPANALGQPALSLPCGRVDGMPVGLQLVGASGADTALLALGLHIERALARAGLWQAGQAALPGNSAATPPTASSDTSQGPSSRQSARRGADPSMPAPSAPLKK